MGDSGCRSLPRRELLAGTVGLALGAAVPLRAAIPAGPPNERLHTYLRMRGGLTERMVIATSIGRYYGVVETEMRPLFDFIAAAFIRHRALSTGGYEVFVVEQTYYTDLESGQVLDGWINPYTHERVAVPPNTVAPRRSVISPEVKLMPGRPSPGSSFESVITGPTPLIDDVLMVDQSLARFAIPGQAQPFHYSEVNGYRCAAADLARPAPAPLKVRTSYESVSSWRPWMNMGERPGHTLGVGLGRVDVEMSQLSAVWVDATRRSNPVFLTSPESLLAPLWDVRS